MSKKLKVNKPNKKRCSSFKIALFKEAGQRLHSYGYYKTMGYIIQHLYEDKKIEIMCRAFIMYDARQSFKLDSMGETCSRSELKNYEHSSEYNFDVIRSNINTGKYLLNRGILYETLDEFAQKLDYSAINYKSDTRNIPNILHHVWLTNNQNNAKKISEEDIKNIVANRKFLSTAGERWKQIIWTNDRYLMSQAKEFKKNKIEVRSIDTLNFHDPFSKDTIMLLLQDKLFGMAVDILRYEVIASNGGVYADLNFKLEKPLKNYMQQYDFFCIDGQVNFFAAKPHHKILEKTIDIVLTKALAHPEILTPGNTMDVTYRPFLEAMIKYSNFDGNHDFMTDYYYFYDLEDKEGEGPLGIDNVHGGLSWVNH